MFNIDIHLHYSEAGEGFPLILLHGNGESNEYFAKQIPEFSKYYRTIAVDTRGHGKSPRGVEPFTLAQFVLDLKNLLDELYITKCHILGFSDGGNIAMMFAMKYPDMVEKLILNGANLTPQGVKKFFVMRVNVEYTLACLREKIDRSATAKREMLGLMVNEPMIRREKLAAITAPTLVIAGSNDLILPEETATIAAGIKNSTLRILRGSHAVARDNPQEYNAAVLDFLK